MIKAGVRIEGLRPEIVLAIVLVQPLFFERGIPLVITSVVDGKHSKGSRHYVGLAVDLRSKQVDGFKQKADLLHEMKKVLGDQYDVILEDQGEVNEHYHIEFDPR